MIKKALSLAGILALPRGLLVASILVLPLLVACSGDSDGRRLADEPPVAEPFAELYSQGILKYLGDYTPMLSEPDKEVINHFFGAGDGPLCGEGAPYSMATRNQESEELLIFLEGGGACWSDFCFYINEVVPGIPEDGLLDPARENNPVKDWSQVYIPYCDGSLHAGDIDVDNDGDGQIDIFHRGLRNLSAALDVATRTFPAPRRILLAGQSGGAFGTTFALPLVRHIYPDAQIDILNDSAVGVLKPGQPEFLRQLIEEWNIGAFFPDSCPECIADDGHFSDYYIWQMKQDPSLRRGLLSYTRDTNLADLFLQIGAEAFEEALDEEMPQQEESLAGRTRFWLVEGDGHTFVTLEPDQTAGGVPLMDWIGAMLSGSDQWVSVQD